MLPFVQKRQSQQCFLKLTEQTGFWAACVAVNNKKQNNKNNKDIYPLLKASIDTLKNLLNK